MKFETVVYRVRRGTDLIKYTVVRILEDLSYLIPF